MSFEHSPHKENSSNYNLDLQTEESDSQEEACSEVFVWDHSGDLSIPPHFESDFCDIDLSDKEFDVKPFWNTDRSLSVSCNRVNRKDITEVTPERRREDPGVLCSKSPTLEFQGKELDGFESQANTEAHTQEVFRAVVDGLSSRPISQQSIRSRALTLSSPNLSLSSDEMNEQTYRETSNQLKRQLRVARRHIGSYTEEHVTALDKLTHSNTLKEINAAVVEVVNQIDIFIEELEDPEHVRQWEDELNSIQRETRANEVSVKQKILECLAEPEAGVLAEPVEARGEARAAGGGHNGHSHRRVVQEAREKAKIDPKRKLVVDGATEMLS